MVDGGESWFDISGKLPMSPVGNRLVDQLLFDPNIEDRYYANVNGFLYVFDGPLQERAIDGGNSGGGSLNWLLIGTLLAARVRQRRN